MSSAAGGKRVSGKKALALPVLVIVDGYHALQA